MTENVQHIRLVNGEELVGDIIGIDGDSIIVDTPMVIDERSTQYGSSIILTEYSPFSMSSVCHIDSKHIITRNQIHPVMKKYYYLSRKISKESTERILADISEVNNTMESILMESSLDATHLCQGTRSKH